MMDTKEYLGQLKNLDKRIKHCLKEAERWYDVAISTGETDYSDIKVQTTIRADKMGDAVTLAVDYQQASRKQAQDFTILRHRIIEQIKGIKGGKDKELYYNILYGMYVDECTLSDLVVSENYSYRQIKRYYAEALKEFEREYGNEYLDKKLPKMPINA